MFQTLTSLVVNFRNFKVRINAAAALATPVSRAMYGTHFVTIWDGLMNGLDNSQTMEDFNEYKHQDNLVNQVSGWNPRPTYHRNGFYTVLTIII